ncbi:MAG: ferredoxin family protein [Bacteroidaceae bacterium]|nr:ferredoxin family protein [Bacteroidaceae bacterium]MBQ7484478.1 ferredoxin family protein [Bacteroidaceae bacterium]
MKHEELITKYITTDSSRCTKCLRCAEVCPAGVFGMKRFLWMKHFYVGDPQSCIGCMKCVKACLEGVFIKTKR